jgi:peptide/nickel transport system ATP-binding protein
MMDHADQALLRVENLRFHFGPSGLSRYWRKPTDVIDNVSFEIARGETLALVGESGSGKSTIARCVAGLYVPTGGRILLGGNDIHSLRGARRTKLFSRRVQMVFQDPFASLNPRWRISSIIAEPINTFGLLPDAKATRRRVDELLECVGLHASDGRRYPHEFSGGQRQRISIARAIAGEPEFLVCDEPTSALDVSILARILNLLRDLQSTMGLTYLLITHNLGTAYQMADRVAVLNKGRICETGTTDEVFSHPTHSYTRNLLSSVPVIKRPNPTPPSLLTG